jgi:glutamate synthase domain-containing protein 2
MNGLVVSDKRVRVYNYHKKTVETALEILGAAGFTSPNDVQVRNNCVL